MHTKSWKACVSGRGDRQAGWMFRRGRVGSERGTIVWSHRVVSLALPRPGRSVGRKMRTVRRRCKGNEIHDGAIADKTARAAHARIVLESVNSHLLPVLFPTYRGHCRHQRHEAVQGLHLPQQRYRAKAVHSLQEVQRWCWPNTAGWRVQDYPG